MAATWIKSLHIGKTRTRSTAIAKIIDYVMNPQKTENGKLITSYACDSRVVDDEFLIAKREYEYITGRNQGKRDVLAYHIRQSFKPGEIDAETANKIGHRLALSFTKGKHAFVVCTHVDKKHIHNHIIFNSTTLDCEGKFNDPKRSGRIIRRISDLLCAEHGLSVIDTPKASKGRNYADWLGDKKEPSWQEKLRLKIDEVLPHCTAFEDFLATMKLAGYTVNDKRKHITFLAPGQKKPTRLDTLKGDYTETAIRERLAGVRTIASSGAAGVRGAVQNNRFPQMENAPHRVNLLIDIQAKIQAGKGEGYEQWARIFNIQQAAKTLLFLRDNGIDSYDDLAKKSSVASGEFAALSEKIKAADKRLAEITELQKQVGTYSKTREIYAQYKASGWDKDFYEQFRADITLHRTAKKHFDSLGLKKLPTMQSLKQEYAALTAEKKKLYSGYHALKQKRTELVTAKHNADAILGVKANAPERNASLSKNKSNSHEK